LNDPNNITFFSKNLFKVIIRSEKVSTKPYIPFIYSIDINEFINTQSVKV